MQKVIFSILFVLMLTSINAQTSNNKIKHFNTENNIAIKGYDPVSYFTQNKAIKGKKNFAVSINGVIYHCSSQTNKELLVKTPAKYEPQYGGWCAYAMGAKDTRVEIDPETFKIKDGKLYLFYNKTFTNTLPSWNKDETNLKTKADENWKLIFSK